MADRIPAGIPQVPGQGAPEGFIRNEVFIFKGYFCKFACQKNWDNFHEEEVLLNKELWENAKKVFNEQEIHNALYDKDADYSRLVKFVLTELIAKGVIREEKHEGRDSTYWKTSMFAALCPKILEVILPDIDAFVEEYNEQQLN
jgi:hypothetical protein